MEEYIDIDVKQEISNLKRRIERDNLNNKKNIVNYKQFKQSQPKNNSTLQKSNSTLQKSNSTLHKHFKSINQYYNIGEDALL